MLHSSIVGGSTAKRVMACPGSVNLCAKMPPKPSSVHADRGTLLHDAIAMLLDGKVESVIGMEYNGIILTQELYDEKIAVALEKLDEIDPDKRMEYAVESRVGFGDLLPGVFGSADLLGRIGNRAIVLDWKFGDGVVVDAVENAQGMFYAAASMRTPETQWVFDGADEVEIIIVQPPMMRRWVTTPERIAKFERDLVLAVKAAQRPAAEFNAGDHCRWCAAKPVCPLLTGKLERAVATKVKAIDPEKMQHALAMAILAEEWAKSVREMAQTMLENNAPIDGWKLVPKRATRQWVDAAAAEKALKEMGLDPTELIVTELKSPAQIEKVLKKRQLELPHDQVVAVSTGNTIAPESDPRPAVLTIGKDIRSAFSKLEVK